MRKKPYTSSKSSALRLLSTHDNGLVVLPLHYIFYSCSNKILFKNMYSCTDYYCIHGLYKSLQLQAILHASFLVTLEITICCNFFSILLVGKLQVWNEMQFFQVHWFIQTLSDLCCVQWCKQARWAAHLLYRRAVIGALPSAASRWAAMQMERAYLAFSNTDLSFWLGKLPSLNF